jgi:YbbR domain-containing protein
MKMINKFISILSLLFIIVLLSFFGSSSNRNLNTVTRSTTGNAVKDFSVDSAYKLCFAFEKTGLASDKCTVSGWGQTVNVTLDMPASEARKFCQELEGIKQGLDLSFRQGWTLKIYSPFSGERSIAYCELG